MLSQKPWAVAQFILRGWKGEGSLGQSSSSILGISNHNPGFFWFSVSDVAQSLGGTKLENVQIWRFPCNRIVLSMVGKTPSSHPSLP